MSDIDPEDVQELLDAVTDDPGGVAYDDDLPDEAPDDGIGGDRGDGRPAYDSPKKLLERNVAFPEETPVGMKRLRTFITENYGGANLGILARPPRSVRGPGDTPSLHNWGMAWDWQWKKPGPGRAGADEVIAWCLEHAEMLGIQAVHDYEQCRYWKSYGKGDGWKEATASEATGFGQPWAKWLHIERTHGAANDDRTIDTALGEQSAAGAADPAVALPESELKVGSRGAGVARLQDFLRLFGFAEFTRSDGQYGKRTRRAVETAQRAFAERELYRSTIDGRWGPRTHEAAQRYVELIPPPPAENA
jgi:hypothetical protein